MAELKKSLFLWLDYVVFGSMLSLSTIIGIYFGFCRKKQNTVDDYLRGGKQMKVLPIAISLISSQIATNTLLAAPADVYRFGANYIWLSVATLIQCTLGYYIFLPVFFKLQITSVFEYLQLRFDKKLRIMASFLNLIGMFIVCPIVIYVPSLAFSQVTGIDVLLISIISFAFCIFYTTIGGFKTVVWTDVLQCFIMITSFLVLFFLGIFKVNGFDELWDKSVKGHRLDIFDFDPTLRDSFGAIMIGGTVHWLAITSVGPISVQKFVSLPTLSDVKNVILIYALGVSLIHVLAALTGLLIYTKYWDCDPFLTKEIFSYDQLVPHFVMEIAGKVLGYPGIFIAGIFSAGMSTVSACLNTIAAVVYEDFLPILTSKNISQKLTSTLLKIIVVISGTICTILVLTLEKINGIFPVYTGIFAAILGPTLGLYVLGILIPMANSKGALYGGIAGISIITFIFIQNQRHQNQALLAQFLKPISISGCSNLFAKNITQRDSANDLPFFLYRISFWFNTLVGSTATVVVGVLVSLLTKHDRAPVPKDLLSPMVNLAAQTLRNSVADALTFLMTDVGHPNFQGAGPTIRFIKLTDQLFDLLNSRNPFEKGCKAPLKMSNIEKYVASPSHQPSLSYITTYKFNQDHLELFSVQFVLKMDGTAYQFFTTYRRMLMHIDVRTNSGNCLSQDSTEILALSQFHKTNPTSVLTLDQISILKKYNFPVEYDVIPELLGANISSPSDSVA